MNELVAKLYMQARKNITARNTYESPPNPTGVC